MQHNDSISNKCIIYILFKNVMHTISIFRGIISMVNGTLLLHILATCNICILLSGHHGFHIEKSAVTDKDI